MSFVKVAKLDELIPGQAKTVTLNGREIALFNVEGEIFATDNTCLHMGGPLGEGDLASAVVTCPWHGWEYNVKTGEALTAPGEYIQKFEVRVQNGDIEVAV